MTRAWRALAQGLLLGGGLAGCTVTARSPGVDEGPNNSCSVDSDCSKGSRCVDEVCRTLSGKLESLLIELTPPSDSTLPHVPFRLHQSDLGSTSADLMLPLVRAQSVEGSLRPPVVSGCQRRYFGQQDNELSPSTDGESMPVKVTLRPQEAALGLPVEIYRVDSTLPKVDLQNGSIHYRFQLQVPAGRYDVYIEPVAQTIAPAVDGAEVDESCRIPPQLFRGTELMAAQGAVDLVLDPHPITEVDISVEFPDARALEGWKIDIIDSLSGLPISSTRTLAGAEPVAGNQHRYRALLAYSALGESTSGASAIEGANDLIRLRPPADVVAPTLFWDRAGLELFGGAGVKINDFTQFPRPVTVQGQMSGTDDGAPVSGRVVLVSIEVSGVDSGILSSYRTIVEVAEDGLFTVDVPPGVYRVFGVPSNEDVTRSLSAYETTWTIPADAPFQAGKLLELPALAQVRGQTGFPGAKVRVSASSQQVLPFYAALGEGEFVPRAFAGLVDEAGHFVLQADPGRFDIAIQPPAASNFAWAVRPGFRVQAGAEHDLGRLSPRIPSVVSGTAIVPESRVVARALVRAYAYLDEDLAYTADPAEAHSVIQVGETRTDDEGAFRLFVPDEIPVAN